MAFLSSQHYWLGKGYGALLFEPLILFWKCLKQPFKCLVEAHTGIELTIWLVWIPFFEDQTQREMQEIVLCSSSCLYIP